MPKTLETVRITFDDDAGIGTVTLDRPESLNALNSQIREDIVTGLKHLEKQNENVEGIALRAVILEGAGDAAFSVGADINEFESGSSGDSSDQSHYEFIRTFPTPIIAKIHGYCLGGGFETALCCDFRFASLESTFGLPEVELGILPGAGGSQMVEKLAGPGVAKELSMTGKHISAQRADEEGLVHETYAVAKLDDAVNAFARELARQPPLAIQRIKKSVNLSSEVGLEEGIEYDSQASSALLQTEDATEGIEAFSENRDPEFEGL